MYFKFFIYTLNIQGITKSILDDIIFDSDDERIPFSKKGPGRGHSRSGKRKRWTKKCYFEQDLLTAFRETLQPSSFKSRFAGYSADEISWFFESIKDNALKPKESFFHARNKLLLWLDKLHNSLSWEQTAIKYYIGRATGAIYVQDILTAIIKSYSNKNVITFLTEIQRIQMEKILKQRRAPVPDALFSLDGSHLRCTGRHISERLSVKYKWLPCFNALFIIERVFNTVCAVNLDPAARKHDITVLRDAWFYNEIEELMGRWIILADKGYQGVQHETSNIAFVLKINDKNRKRFSDRFWKQINAARADVERVFAHFFYNKFTQLGAWKGKSGETFQDWALNVICCIIVYNTLKINFQQN